MSECPAGKEEEEEEEEVMEARKARRPVSFVPGGDPHLGDFHDGVPKGLLTSREGSKPTQALGRGGRGGGGNGGGRGSGGGSGSGRDGPATLVRGVEGRRYGSSNKWKQYESRADAGRAHNVVAARISDCVTGKREHVGGFEFREGRVMKKKTATKKETKNETKKATKKVTKMEAKKVNGTSTAKAKRKDVKKDPRKAAKKARRTR
jgi:hypothetical protein